MECTSLLLILATSLVLGTVSGTMGAVYRCILAYEPILHWWFKFGNRFEKRWFFQAIWGCQKCISGQLALWSYAGLLIFPRIVKHWRQIWQLSGWDVERVAAAGAGLFGLILAICVAIAVAQFTCKAIQSLEK